jgi:hypothetical protein
VSETAVVITTINPPTTAMRMLARGCAQHRYALVVAGDSSSPPDFDLPDANFLALSDQLATGFAFARACPTRSYARKNVGYLAAIRGGAQWIIETDDDNLPHPEFFLPRRRSCRVKTLGAPGWVNIYAYFTDVRIWPRGLPLTEVNEPVPAYDTLPTALADCPIQQGLANDNPDVDAIYRLVLPLPVRFRTDRRLALGGKSWSPFNSQNTSWHREAFPLLYLPATCTFRLTDIWRGLVALRIARESGWSLLVHEPTVWQDRNEHDLMKDFAGEIPGYLHSGRLATALDELALAPGAAALAANLRTCYRRLVELELVQPEELDLLEAWLGDLRGLGVPCA